MRPSSCAVAICVNSAFARHCFDLIRELTPATVCWTRWNHGSSSSGGGGTESCRETVFHVASWSGVPGQSPPPADSLPGHDWVAAFILSRWSRGLTVAYPPSRPPPPHPPLQSSCRPPFTCHTGEARSCISFRSPPPVRAVMLIVPPWQHVARWMQLSGFWRGRDSSSGRDRWRRTMTVMSEYCRESKKKKQKHKNKGVEHDSQANKRREKWVLPDKRWSAWPRMIISFSNSKQKIPLSDKKKKKIGV